MIDLSLSEFQYLRNTESTSTITAATVVTFFWLRAGTFDGLSPMSRYGFPSILTRLCSGMTVRVQCAVSEPLSSSVNDQTLR